VAMLVLGVVLNFALIPVLGIVALATTTALTAWLNMLALYVVLARRGHFHVQGWLWGRILRQLVAGALMAAVIWFVSDALAGWFAGSTGRRLLAVGAITGAGATVYFAVAWVIGGINRDDILILMRKKKPA